MSTVTSIQGTDVISVSRTTINTNFGNLNTDKVELTGNETIAGIKTFSSSPIVPTPTTATQAANKTYVDSKGPWILVGYLAGSTTSFSISGLDLATDLNYKVLVQFDTTSAPTTGQSWGIRINGISTGTYDYNRVVFTAGTLNHFTATAQQQIFITSNDVKRKYFGELNFSLLTNQATDRILVSGDLSGMTDPDGTTNTMERTLVTAWESSQSNLTSIDFRAIGVSGSPAVTYKYWILKLGTS